MNAFLIKSTGYYEYSYKCRCKERFVWSEDSKKCAIKDKCADLRTDGRNCVAEHTKSCNIMKIISEGDSLTELVSQTLGFRCTCEEGFSGFFCEKEMNPCFEITPGASTSPMIGNEACRVYLGNKCIPKLGTSHFICECVRPWATKLNAGFPNCFRKSNICDKVICQNGGECKEVYTKEQYKCICPDYAFGKHCERANPFHWEPWGSWNQCSGPPCSGMGWRRRTRKCQGDILKQVYATKPEYQGKSCLGRAEDLKPCTASCPSSLHIGLPFFKLLISAAFFLFGIAFITWLLHLRCNADFQ
ncbi:hypothetical protein Ciccas_010539 [Cichlidogyrus casuarinus]|uniref:EGF-like domain-containing protein n=1 Tax=Cichlidogyrus casuarinus TaxID=1844966 RepID=A0ABD2PWS4_9PLAT